MGQKAIVLLALSLGVESSAAEGAEPVVSHAPPRLVPEKIFAAVAEKLPKYVAPIPGKEAEEKSSEKPNDGTSGTLTLPKVTVRPRVAAPPVDGAFLTPKARMDLAMKENPGLRIGNLFGANRGIASFMQTEERELKAKEALADTVQRTTSNDGAEAKEVRELLEKASQRINADWSGQSRP